MDVGEAISLLSTSLFSSSIDSLHLQTLTLLPYDCYYSLCLSKSPYWDQLLVKHVNVPQRRQSQAWMPGQHSLVLPPHPNPHSLSMSSLGDGVWHLMNLPKILPHFTSTENLGKEQLSELVFSSYIIKG